MTAPHLDPARKHDFVFLIEATDSNPNGDPDNGGLPRTDPVTGQGLITDVAVKRKIRNTVALINEIEKKLGYEIYVEAGVALNAQHERAYAGGDKGGNATDQVTARQWMCQNFFDVRMFGAVMSTGRADRKAGRVQGPVQIGFARSIDPVTPFDIGITRVTPTRQEDVDAWNNPEEGKNKGKETEMGSKHIVPYGLYKGAGHFSAPLAAVPASRPTTSPSSGGLSPTCSSTIVPRPAPASPSAASTSSHTRTPSAAPPRTNSSTASP